MTILNYPVKRNALAQVYKINTKSLRERLREIGIDHGHTLSPKEIKRIISNYDLPDGVEIKL